MTIKVSAGLPAGTYHLTVIGDEHGNTHRGIATFKVAGAAVAPPALHRPGPRGIVGSAPLPPRTVSTGSVGISTGSGHCRADADADRHNPTPARARDRPVASAGSAPALAGGADPATPPPPRRPAPDAPATATRAPYRIRSAGTFVIAC